MTDTAKPEETSPSSLDEAAAMSTSINNHETLMKSAFDTAAREQEASTDHITQHANGGGAEESAKNHAGCSNASAAAESVERPKVNGIEERSQAPTVTPDTKKESPKAAPEVLSSVEAGDTSFDDEVGPSDSLDNAQELAVSDLDEQPASSERHGSRAHRRRLGSEDLEIADEYNHEDDDSSNDESSYFADPNNLPSPKSSRRFSFSSNHSAHGHASVGSGHHRKESDASLSLSDDSDEAAAPPKETLQHAPDPERRHHVADLQAFPIVTKMHSVSSLISTSSHNSSGSETSVQDELRKVAKPPAVLYNPMEVPSGRRSPVLGNNDAEKRRALYYSPSPNPQPSPPTIAVPNQQGYMKYQHPQVLSAADWVASMGQEAAAPPPGSYPQQQILPQTSRGSMGSGSLAYSTDGDDVHFAGRRQSGRRNSKNAPSSRETSGGVEESTERAKSSAIDTSVKDGDGDNDGMVTQDNGDKAFQVYWRRWLMLMYMSVLNLLSDWTCYSVAPIAVLTEQAFGHINAEQLVTVFLAANAIASACEPIILSRLGLRRTVVMGALFLMIGSIVKSGGMPPIIRANLKKGEGEWRVYLGFFLVGLSQPLYQCTPALLSASWFPERERTMATGVALNANQLGIGFAFIFGTLLVESSDDIPSYFGLLSIISTIAFMGTLLQFDDAPPTPPSDTARVMRGTFEVNIPSPIQSMIDTVRNLGGSNHGSPLDKDVRKSLGQMPPAQASNLGGSHYGSPLGKDERKSLGQMTPAQASKPKGLSTSSSSPVVTKRKSSRSRKKSGSSGSHRAGGGSDSSSTRRRSNSGSRTTQPGASSANDPGFHGLTPAPSPANYGSAAGQNEGLDAAFDAAFAPSPMMQGGGGGGGVPPMPASDDGDEDGTEAQLGSEQSTAMQRGYAPPAYYYPSHPPYGQGYPGHQGFPPTGLPAVDAQSQQAPHYGFPVQHGHGFPPYAPPQYPYNQYMDPRMMQQYAYQAYYQQQSQFYPQGLDPYYYNYQQGLPYPPARSYPNAEYMLPQPSEIDEGVEPILTCTDHHLDIHIRDDQVLLSIRACLARPGFVHALVAFTVSGIVINTLSTFMDYLVRLNGAGREMTGIVGGSFQFCIMISSLIIGSVTDKTRAYYSVIVAMLVLGAFGLAECGVNLDSNRGKDLRWSLVIVAILVGPLQPVSTELGVDVVYPLSENTVLVIQQLFSNLLSALFIPCFKAMRDIGVSDSPEGGEQPQYTFSFYLLIVLHAAATVFFATFNGRYLRYEHEEQKKALEEQRKNAISAAAFEPVYYQSGEDYNSERHPLV